MKGDRKTDSQTASEVLFLLYSQYDYSLLFKGERSG